MELPVATEVRVDNSAWKRPGAADHATPPSSTQFFSHFTALLGINRLYTRRADKVLKQNAVEQLQFTAPSFSFVVASLCHKVSVPLQIERSAVKGPRMIELNDEGSAARSLATVAEVVLSPEGHRPHVYRAEVSQLGLVLSSSVKKRKPSSSMITIGSQSKNVTRTSPDEELIKIEVESLKTGVDVKRATLAISGARQAEVESAFQVLEPAMREYSFVKDTSFKEPKDLQEPATGAALHGNANLMLADPSYHTSSAPGQASSAQVVFYKDDT